MAVKHTKTANPKEFEKETPKKEILIIKLRKKGVLKTLEALIASLLIVLFVAFVIPTNVRIQTEESVGVLEKLSFDQNFRHCIVTYNNTCTDNYIKENLPTEYKNKYSFLITKDMSERPTNLPKSQIISENAYITTDGYIHNEYVVRLYYWKDD